ncbi:uncharacterized protein [Cicer arietinum]|uniref:Cysteine-rich receptor-like protein kinase 23 n=1 Tax=Cicer arietinum TaxID=3827 RepID=A0A1S2XMN0_CICAR|nr:putative cysteine-rich receptor-like protein kinase 23 [Cicer arietinum]
MALSKVLYLSILVNFLLLTIIKAQDTDTPVYVYKNCSINATTTNKSTFEVNLKTLLSSLSSKTNDNTEFYNTTVTGVNPSDSVYGLFMCRGDVPSQLCHQCIVNATQILSSECSLSKQAVIWYDECTVRYSYRSFFSTFDTRPRLGVLNTGNVSNQNSFMRLLFSTMNQTADEAARSLLGDENKKFATKQATISGSQNLYCLAQCTPDLSPNDCRSCLSRVIGDLPWCCEGKQGGRVLYPSCNVRYELYPFYRNVSDSSTPAALVPETNDSKQDSGFSQDPFYLFHNCSSNHSLTKDNTFQIYTKTLFSYLSSYATNGKIFYKDNVEQMVYDHFMCRGDLPPHLCGQCVKNATDRLSSNSKCRSSLEGIIWYSHCLLRYSDQYFYKMETSPMYSDINISTSNSEQNSFTNILSNQLSQLAKDTGNSVERYSAKSVKLNDVQTLYTLEQCTQDLSSDDCILCLNDVIGTTIPWSLLGSVGGRVLYPSCNLRFELFRFYGDNDETQPPSSPMPSSRDAGELFVF